MARLVYELSGLGGELQPGRHAEVSQSISKAMLKKSKGKAGLLGTT